jgi:hypothetical protein
MKALLVKNRTKCDFQPAEGAQNSTQKSQWMQAFELFGSTRGAEA